MKHLKRLQAIEAQLSEAYSAKELEAEYFSWLRQHPIEEIDDHSFDFNSWLDSMPSHLMPFFQWQFNQMFPFLDLPTARLKSDTILSK